MPVLRLLAFLAIATLVACTTTPTGRSQFIVIPEDQMAQMGASAFATLRREGDVSGNRGVNRYVQCVANALTRQVPGAWEVVVFDDASPNAFALPGGKIGVHSGLLDVAKNQHQLAAVIGHEIAHVQARHGAERVSQQFAAQTAMALVQSYTRDRPQAQQQAVLGLLGAGAQVGVLLPFSRVQESEADHLGLMIMARAGFDPAQSVELWRNMKSASSGRRAPEFLSTHPAPDSRIRALGALIPEAEGIASQARREGTNPRCRR